MQHAQGTGRTEQTPGHTDDESGGAGRKPGQGRRGMQDLAGRAKEYTVFSRNSEEPLASFKQESDII